MMAAVGVVDWITRHLSWFAVPSIEQALLAVTRSVTHAVLEQVAAVDSLSDGRTVAIDDHIVAAFERVIVTRVRVAFLLKINTIITDYLAE